MTQDEFTELCRAAGFVLSLADAEAFASHGYTVIDGVDIGVVLDDDAGRILCCVALGTVDPIRRTDIYEELLGMNAEIEDLRDGSFGVDLDSGTALLNVEIALERAADAAMFAEVLANHAAYANEVRRVLLDPSDGDATGKPVGLNLA